MMKHGTYDEFWKARNLRPHLRKIKPAVLTVGGWFDAENLFGALETYQSVEFSSQNQNLLVMGPWDHGGWSRGEGASLGHVSFQAKTSEFYRDQIEFPFFEHHLKGTEAPKLPEAFVFETGRNQWRRHGKWPPQEAKPRQIFLSANGELSWQRPSNSESQDFDEYTSDPAKPVPVTEDIAIGMTREYMVADQRFAARRPDVLVYQTDPLDSDLTLAGPIEADLFVSTTGTDADWIVKVIDVYPPDFPDPDPNPSGVRMGGFQQLVRGDVMRGKFRSSYSSPSAFEPGKPTRVKFTLKDVYHTFRNGHRLMVQIQSSWFPLVDRNPQQFLDINQAKDSDFQKASHRVHRSAELSSSLNLLSLP
jgi:putative CocE/NonD family hydrolase